MGEKLKKCEKIAAKEREEAEAKFKNMKKDLDELMKEKTALTKEVEKCRQKEKDMTKKVADLKKIFEEQKTHIEDAKKKNDELKAELDKKTGENAKLKADLEEALKNAGSSEEVDKLKKEKEKLEKENREAKKKIEELEKEIQVITEGQKSVEVKFGGAKFGATSEADFCEAEKAFTGDHYSSWTSLDEAPQTIWVRLEKASRLTWISFKCSVAPENGASKFEVVATNDKVCNEHSSWDVIYQDLSGKGFVTDQDTITAQVDACKLYNCYGIRVLDVNNIEGQKWVIMSEVKMWARA